MLGSWIPSLWGDEAASVLSAQRPIGSLFTMLGHVDAVHGTYYFGLHFWIAAFGSSPFAMRLPSAIAIGVAVAGVTWLGWRLAGPTVGIASGLICAVLPRLTLEGSEVRSYAFSAAIAVWLTVMLLALLRRPGPRRRIFLWVAYGLVSALAIYVFLYLVLLLLVHAVIVAAARPGRRTVVTWAVAVFAAATIASPVIYWGLHEAHQIAFLGHRNPLTITSLGGDMWFGGKPVFAVIAWALIVVAAVGGLRDRGLRTRDGLPSLEVVALAWLLIPPMLLSIEQLLHGGFATRYATFCAPAAALLMGAGVVRVAGVLRRIRPPRRSANPASRGRTILVGALAVVVLAAVPGYVGQRMPTAKNHSDWQQIGLVIAAHSRPDDAIVFDDSVRPSRRTRLAADVYPSDFRNVENVTLAEPSAETTTWHDTAYTIAETVALGEFDDVNRVWVVEYSTGSHIDGYGLATLAKLGFTTEHSYRLPSSVVFELERTTGPAGATVAATERRPAVVD